MVDGRAVSYAHTEAVTALERYARLLFEWEAGDPEYARNTIRAMAIAAIAAEDLRRVGEGEAAEWQQ